MKDSKKCDLVASWHDSAGCRSFISNLQDEESGKPFRKMIKLRKRGHFKIIFTHPKELRITSSVPQKYKPLLYSLILWVTAGGD
jgi:hypothetical protein